MKKAFTFLLLFLALGCFKYAKSQENVGSKGQIPILAWEWKASSEELTTARFQEMKAAGITYDFTYFADEQAMAKGLRIAQKTGIKMIVFCPELKTNPQKTVEKIMNSSALAGYFLDDEPNKAAFPNLSEWVKEIHDIDSNHFCYINLLPNYANAAMLGVKTYREYVDSFITKVPVQFLSFDNYPVIGYSLRWNWYENLEVFSKAARNGGKPFWAFALTLAHGPYPVPTIAQLRLQVYSNLAYGAQGIQYFRYWTPKNDPWDFHHGPIASNSKRSEVYYRIKLVNKEIKNLSWVFLGSKVISVTHTGDTIPFWTKQFGRLPPPIKTLKTEGKGAVVSVMENGKNSFLVIVNRDFISSMKLTIDCDSTVKKVLKDGTIVPADAYINTM